VRGTRHAPRGQALAEFALSATALLIFLFGVVVVARGLFVYDLVASGARQGARWAMVRGNGCAVSGCPASSTSVKAYVMTKVPGIADTNLTVITNFSGSSTAGCTDSVQKGRACTVAVTVSYPYTFGYPLKMVATLASTSTMVMSQ
jgi:Flp pilus assembly protein TadG